MTNPYEDRYVVDENGCWIWQGYLTPAGYGRAHMDGNMRPAHRVVYTHLVAPVPRELVLDHLCRVRACVNPDHMEPVTNAENLRRGSRTKLNAEIVAEIRSSPERVMDIAERLGIARSCVSNIRAGRRWKDAA